MQKLIHEKYDLSLLNTKSVKELISLWGISKARIYKIKKKLGYTNCKEISSRKIKILDYLRKNNGEIKSIRQLCKVLKISTNDIRISYITDLCRANNIILKIIPKNFEYKHSHYYYLKGCNCDICKLANNLSVHACKYFKRVYSEFLNRYANENIDFYLDDKTVHKKSFYNKFKIDYSNYLKTKPIRTKTKNPKPRKHVNRYRKRKTTQFTFVNGAP